jgi:hypothetical protein
VIGPPAVRVTACARGQVAMSDGKYAAALLNSRKARSGAIFSGSVIIELVRCADAFDPTITGSRSCAMIATRRRRTRASCDITAPVKPRLPRRSRGRWGPGARVERASSGMAPVAPQSPPRVLRAVSGVTPNGASRAAGTSQELSQASAGRMRQRPRSPHHSESCPTRASRSS